VLPRRALAPGVAALGLQVVVAGGFEASARDGGVIAARVDALDTVTGRWVAQADAPVRWTDINLAVVGGTLYLLGGFDAQGVAHGETFALDPLTHTWRPIAAMPAGAGRGGAAVVTAPGRIFLLGGAAANRALATCLEYDTIADRWVDQPALPDLPAPRAHAAAMRLADGTLIVAGGFSSGDTSAPHDEVWGLSPPGGAGRAWHSRASIHMVADPERTPDPDRRGGCAYGVVLGQLVCAGGAGGTTARRAVDSYDPYVDRWTKLGDALPVARAGAPGAVVGGRLYVPGGADTLAIEPSDTLYVYAPLDTAR
jgi:hypothetical protein